jgi:GNAT superfamily N-acetyltransferase
MTVEIRQVGVEDLADYGRIPIRFRVESLLRVGAAEGGLGGLTLTEEKLDRPYVKDYDQCESELPARWVGRFDVSNWGLFIAYDAALPVGAAAVARRTPQIRLLGDRSDMAALWDIRVHPDHRRRGIGGRLFRQGAEWARGQGCRLLGIETQNINVGACRFYIRQGCHLGAIDRYGYRGDPRVGHEVMLLWYLDL